MISDLDQNVGLGRNSPAPAGGLVVVVKVRRSKAKRPAAPPSDLKNLEYLEDMRARVGELAQLAQADVSAARDTARHFRFIDAAEAVHDYLVRLSLQERGLA